jgi:D-xylose transport system permease protein
MSSTLEHDPRVIAERAGLAGLVADYGRRLSRGDIGQLPVVISLLATWTVFEIASGGTFLRPFNLVNLTLQMASGGMISIGIVLVLLIGEIDLSAGIVSGLCGAIMAVLNVSYGLPGPVAVGLAILAGLAVGAVHGVWSVGFGVPAFIVTLAGQLSWLGALLEVLGRNGTVNLRDPFITSLAGTFLIGPYAYGAAALFVAYFALGPLVTRRRRIAAGLNVQPNVFVAARAVVVAVGALAVVIVLDADRGISSGIVILIGAAVIMDFVLRRVRFGRMIYAIGGNAEAARRAGIPVKTVRIAVFMLGSMFAAFGGILGASRLYAVNQSAGSGEVLINAIAAAVIGGTSLFGGRGSVWGALLGSMVIQSISNGMDLLSLSSGLKFNVTGVVLLLTATVDAVLRRSRSASGR